MRIAEQFMGALAICAYLTATFLPCGSLALVPLATSPASGIHAMLMDSGSESHEMAASHGSADAYDDTHEDVHQVAESDLMEFNPTCACGCSNTRSQVGGGAARLGSVVLGSVAARLIEAGSNASTAPVPIRMIDFRFDLDPIPI